MEKKSPFFKSSNGKEELRRGNVAGYHVSIDFLIDLIKKKDKRLRLLPPYREHLSQAFARFFMRVGLPVDIPEFKK